MTTIAKLLGRKQRLLERLQENPSPHERNETVRLLMQIETALDLVEETGPAQTERIPDCRVVLLDWAIASEMPCSASRSGSSLRASQPIFLSAW